MIKITLKIEDIFTLQNELNNFLKIKLTVGQRFSLREILNIVSNELKVASETREELIKKFGTEDDEKNITITPNTEEFNSFVKEWKQILETEKEIELPKFDLESFKNIETDIDINILFKLK